MTTTQQSSTSAPKASSLKLFISYARPDLPIVKELYDYLHREGFSEIFWDQDLNPGSDWSQVLTKTLKDADVVLVCISRQSIASPSVANEINLSRMSTKDQLLIPIRLDDSPVPVSLQSIQWLDLSSSMSLSEKEARYNILVKALLRFEAEKNNESVQVNVVSGYSDPSTGSDSVTTMEILPGMRLGLDPKDATNRTVVNDRAKEHITDDRLNFVPYVKALHEFIKAPETTTPLAISINGLWGTGKSSLMGMLMQEIEPEQRKRWHMHWQGLAWHVGRRKPLSTLWLSRLLLRLGGISERRHQNAMLALIAQRKRMPSPYYPTVWFNAWKFSQEEQIWSALAFEILNQLNHKKYTLLSRLQFWSLLTLKRSNLGIAIGRILLNLLPTILLVFSIFIYTNYFSPWLHQMFPHIATTAVANAGGTTLGIAAFISLLITSFKASKVNPFRISTKGILDSPNYQDKIGYISQFDKDFRYIVKVVTGLSSIAWEAQKLVIFIDDLDRCPYLQAVGIIEAISLFLDSEQCVFVLGMDSLAVATSIEAKYKELVEKMRHDKPDIVSPGSMFLEKIVQITLNIPQAEERYIDILVENLTHFDSRPLLLQNSQSPQILASNSDLKGKSSKIGMEGQDNRKESSQLSGSGQITSTYFQYHEVQKALKHGSRLLKRNPRQVKRFVNTFRLKIFLADQQGILTGQEEDLVDFAVALVWQMQWADVAKLVLYGTHGTEVCTYLLAICQNLEKDGSWKQSADANASISSINKENQVNINTPSLFEQTIEDLSKRREATGKFPSHWYFLPWEEWVCDKDFRYCLMRLQTVWQILKAERDFHTPNQESAKLIDLMKL